MPQVNVSVWVPVVRSLLKFVGLTLLWLSLTACSPSLSGEEQAQPTELGDRIILTNAQIYTLNEEQPAA